MCSFRSVSEYLYQSHPYEEIGDGEGDYGVVRPDKTDPRGPQPSAPPLRRKESDSCTWQNKSNEYKQQTPIPRIGSMPLDPAPGYPGAGPSRLTYMAPVSTNQGTSNPYDDVSLAPVESGDQDGYATMNQMNGISTVSFVNRSYESQPRFSVPQSEPCYEQPRY